MALISAHRCGAGTDLERENTRVALESVLALDAEYVEFDVQRCADGTLVLFHDDDIEVDGRQLPLASITYPVFAAQGEHFLRYDEVLDRLAAAGRRAHVDLKLVSPDGSWEVEAAREAVSVLGDDHVVVTTRHDRSVEALTAWAAGEGVDLKVGLSLGRHGWRVLLDLLPRRRFRRTGATVVAAQHRLARLTLARFARRHGLPLLVWTVDDPADLAHWLRPGRAWMVTTNEPARALRVRARLRT